MRLQKKSWHARLALREVGVDVSLRLSRGAWAPLFVQLVRAELRDSADLVFTHNAESTAELDEINDVVVIESARGRHGSGLQIVVRRNEPRAGFSADPSCEGDWSRGCCWSLRTPPRIEIRPASLVCDMFYLSGRASVISGTDVQRLTDFPAWPHGVYHRRNPSDHMAVFHSDFNVGYPAVRLVARAICAHRARA